MTNQSIKERSAEEFTRLSAAGKAFVEGYMRGYLMAYQADKKINCNPEPERKSA
jgi:hypothetical protein